MIRTLYGIALLALFIAARFAQADTPNHSLFFTDDELQTIGASVAAMPSFQPQDEAGSVRLDAIIYGGPDDWSVWLNGQKFTPETQPVPNLRLTRVTNDQATVIVDAMDHQDQETITLRPGQTWSPSTGAVLAPVD